MTDSPQLDGFRELASEPVEAQYRVNFQVRAGSIWVAAYRQGEGEPTGGRHVWSRRYERPAGKLLEEAVAACLTAVLRAALEGHLR